MVKKAVKKQSVLSEEEEHHETSVMVERKASLEDHDELV
jgi:hypothetical protein